MNNEWKDFLNDNGAEFADGLAINFGNPVREQQVSTNNSPSGTVITDLSHLGVIRAQGSDAAKFLQGQLTNDIHQVNADQCQLSGYCNPQGRLLAIFQIFHYQDAYYLLLPASLIQATLERLKKFIMMSKLTLEDVSDDWIRIGVYGQQAGERLQPLLGELPTAEHNCRQHDEFCVLHVAGQAPRYLVFGPTSAMQTLWGKLDVHAAAVGASNWNWHDIQAGLPVVYPETMGSFIPQMANLDAFDAINFKKGCYTGQEIIARLHYRGSVKRRMYLAHIATDANTPLPQPNDILYHAQAEQEAKAIGHIVRCQAAPEGGASILAIIVNQVAQDGLKDGQIHWQSITGPTLEARQQPYTLDEGSDADASTG